MRARELSDDERTLRESLDPSAQPVLAPKRLLLFKEMLCDAGADDALLFDDICNGFRLVGDLQPSGQFSQQWKPAALSVEQLRQTSVWAQHAVIGECMKIGADEELARAVWADTIDQASSEKQWVCGPFTAEQVTARLGPHWVPSKRFGVRQSGKIRPVDDFSQYLINSSTSCHENIDLEGIDKKVAASRFFLGACDESGNWRLPSRDGLLQGRIAPDWGHRQECDIWGRCLDLRQACEQLVRHKDDAWASVLAVLCPDDSKVYFGRLLRPFLPSWGGRFPKVKTSGSRSPRHLRSWGRLSLSLMTAAEKSLFPTNRLGDCVSKSIIESLKGCLHHARGIPMADACQLLHSFSEVGSSLVVTPELLVAPSSALDMLKNAKPRCIKKMD